MALFKQTSKESKRMTELVDKICKEFNIDQTVALHFINGELERIYNYKIRIDDTQLLQLENEIKKHIKTETELKQEVEKKEKLIQDTLIKIENMTSSVKQKSELLATEQEKVAQLQIKLNDLKAQLTNTDKKKKILDYDIMMKSHSIKEATDKSYKYLKLFLAVITILAIITFILLNYKK